MAMDPASTSGGGTSSSIISEGAMNESGFWSAIRAQHSTMNRYKFLLYGLGIGLGVGLTGVGVYYFLRKRGRAAQKSALEKAESCKADGIEAYRRKQYREAILIFTEAVQLLNESKEKGKPMDQEKRRELIASCENNIAACYDALQDPVQCIEHCSAAIRLKPGYTKPLNRRAKCFHLLGRNNEALEDYFDLISMENGAESPALQQQTLIDVQTEMDRVAEAMIKPELDAIIQSRSDRAQKISQQIVFPWHFNTAVNDPLLIRASALDAKAAETNEDHDVSLDTALLALKRYKYDEVASLSIPVVEDKQKEPLERAHAVLLAARFLDYQGLHQQAKTMADRFNGFWEQLDQDQKLAHKDLQVAHIGLQMQLNFGLQMELKMENEDLPAQESQAFRHRLQQMAEDGLRINDKNVDVLILLGQILLTEEQPEEALLAFQRSRKLDNDHPFVRYYEIYAAFLCTLRQENMAGIHNNIVEMERVLKDTERPPVFALLMMAKIGILMGNQAISLESIKRAIQQMPNNSYAIYLAGMLDQQPSEEGSSAEVMALYLTRMGRAMQKALEADPNYWEPYRMLAKYHMNKQEFDDADRMFGQALELARHRDELLVLLKERLMVRLTGQKRIRELPKRGLALI